MSMMVSSAGRAPQGLRQGRRSHLPSVDQHVRARLGRGERDPRLGEPRLQVANALLDHPAVFTLHGSARLHVRGLHNSLGSVSSSRLRLRAEWSSQSKGRRLGVAMAHTARSGDLALSSSLRVVFGSQPFTILAERS